jgi:hypothetical protein
LYGSALKIESVHDQLGGRIADQDIVEQDMGGYEQEEYIWQKNQWCPRGLTKIQKRRVQRLRNDEQQEAKKKSKVWQVKQIADKNKGKQSAMIGATFMLPAEFRAAEEEIEDSDDDVAIAQWIYQVPSATFEKPKRYLHLKALYLKGFIDGKPMTKMLDDGGAAVNLMPYTTFRKLGKKLEDLSSTDMKLTDFSGKASMTKGAICVELTIGSKSLPTTFFVFDAKGSYSILLGRDWIHANCCIPSTMHQSLIQWIGDTVEVVPWDSSVSVAYVSPNE